MNAIKFKSSFAFEIPIKYRTLEKLESSIECQIIILLIQDFFFTVILILIVPLVPNRIYE